MIRKVQESSQQDLQQQPMSPRMKLPSTYALPTKEISLTRCYAERGDNREWVSENSTPEHSSSRKQPKQQTSSEAPTGHDLVSTKQLCPQQLRSTELVGAAARQEEPIHAAAIAPEPTFRHNQLGSHGTGQRIEQLPFTRPDGKDSSPSMLRHPDSALLQVH